MGLNASLAENMKKWQIITYGIGVTALVSLGVVMAVTNPSQSAYEAYAVEQLTKLLKKDVCVKIPKLIENLLQNNCSSIVDANRAQIEPFIATNTQRNNFVFF